MICIDDYEEYAKNNLERRVWTYCSQGAERDETLKENIISFARCRLVPRMLCNAPSRDMSVIVLGEKMLLPIGLAPTGHQKLFHPEGEMATAAAAAETGVIFTLSTAATTSLEDVAQVIAGRSPFWMQLYIMKERKYTEEMVKRAVACGCKALVLTVDTPVKGHQHRMQRVPLKLPPHLTVANIKDEIKKTPNSSEKEHSLSGIFCDTLTWDDVAWIKSLSNLPLVLKGIMTAEDAVQAVRLGVSAVWVSNHGGRQLDGVEATLDVLPSISSALSGSGCEVYMDGGIRWGSDVLKALALGARAVFIGRPFLWGLSHSGKVGVKKILEILRSELDRAMHLSGCTDIQDIGPHLVKNVQSPRL